MTEAALEHQLSEAAKLIQFMLPFLDAKAKESGDVAGIQLNAKQFLCSPIVVRTRTKAANEEASESDPGAASKDRVIQAAKSLLANWDEFGPDGGLDGYMEALRDALTSFEKRSR